MHSASIVPSPEATNAVRTASVGSATPPQRRSWSSVTAAVAVLLQVAWALAIPIKNVAVIGYPRFVEDRVDTVVNTSYPGMTHASESLNGTAVLAIVQDVLLLSLGDITIRRKLEEKGDFVIDDLSPVLTPKQHNVFSVYYGLVLQSSEVFAGTLTPRSETVVINGSHGNQTEVTITCAAEDAFIQGMRCTNADGTPCDDSSFVDAVPNPTTKLEFVDLNATFANETVGWHNSAGLLAFVEYAHQLMRLILSKQDWATAVQLFSSATIVYAPYDVRTMSQLDEQGRLVMPDEATLWSNSGAYLKYGKRNFSSCAVTEVLLSYIYTRAYVLDMIQSMLTNHSLYNVSSTIVPVDPRVKDRAAVLFSSDLHVTVTIGAGAHKDDYQDKPRLLFHRLMTQSSSSLALFKHDREMQGAMLMGSSMRAIWHFVRYPNSYYSYMTPQVRDDDVNLNYHIIGAFHTGFNGMKFDFTHNTMAVWKLQEQSKAKSVAAVADAFDTEQQFAEWYRNYELDPANGLLDAVSRYFGRMDAKPEKQVECYQGLFRKFAQVAWVMALRLKPVMNHLAYTSMVDGGDPASWTTKQMLVTELMGEDPYGNRVEIPYVRPTLSPNTGNAWVMIPLLRAFIQAHNTSVVTDMLMAEMNQTYTTLIELEAGDTHFRDVVFCPLGRIKFGVSESDDKASMYNKLYQPMRSLVTEFMNNVSAIYDAMSNAIDAVAIPDAFALYNRSHPIFNYEGAPVYWAYRPFSIGLIRLTTKEAPIQADLARFKASFVCYDTLELRYLNVSNRCWNELRTTQETRVQLFSEGLRVITFSMWSMGVVLNIIGSYVAFEYCVTLWRCWNLSGREHVPWSLALSLSIQSIGMLNLLKCTIMALGVLPLIISYHLKSDSEFRQDGHEYAPAVVELFVALGMTWYLRLGMEIGRYRIRLKHFNKWFFVTTSYVRNLGVFLVCLVRLAIPVEQGEFDAGVIKLLFDPKDAPPKDKLSQLFLHAGFDRNWHGVLGQNMHGWSHLGLLYEGWLVVQRDGGGLGMVRSRYLDFAHPASTRTLTLDRRTYLDISGESVVARQSKRDIAKDSVKPHLLGSTMDRT
ncbi:TPA: hypothetical protein N0F65_001682 [Lagenidium giganteum]|uniref:Uncharacterized protein n=1 Tax=Lagenidium giganteum TaxID=4803 RepID=A0AAV2YXT3_9STRA|nr:TPA: hypothetical protein N0F65_001682 [Lagenidium giganteum]